jgi:uncharacterized LabA/DUF88 family protein
MTRIIADGIEIDVGVLNALKKIRPFERLMIFIDGGFLRHLCEKFELDFCKADFTQLKKNLLKMFNKLPEYPFRANLIRIYYYDALADEESKNYQAQKKFFDEISKYSQYTVRLGDLVQSSKENKQKGVDILIAIDALSKAYQDHYDIGLFILGDRDFKPLIEAIKNSGKKTVCLTYEKNVSPELLKAFDFRMFIDKGVLKGLFPSNKS